MPISPPSDIVLDALRAGDRTRQAALHREFSRIAAQPADRTNPTAAARFSRLSAAARPAGLPFDAAAALVAQRNRQVLVHPTAAPANPQPAHTTPAAQKFEAMMLQNFVGTMLPDADGTAFGKGIAATAARSWMAEAVASQLAAAGGIGIAQQIDASLAQKTNPAASQPASLSQTLTAAEPSATASAATAPLEADETTSPLGGFLATLQAFLLEFFDDSKPHPDKSQTVRLSR